MGRAIKENMRIKESLALDSIIRDRANTLSAVSQPDMLEKKARVLVALMDCRAELDQIMTDEEAVAAENVTNVGDINVNIEGGGKGRGGAGGKVPFQPFDGGDLGRDIARRLKAEIRTGSI